MTSERWAQIEELFHRAVECASEQRSTLMDEACVNDAELRREVEALLSCDGNAAVSVRAVVLGGLDEVGFPLTDETISHYRILNGLGGGGMGLVYLAEDIKLGRRVALKFLPEESVKDPAALGRFEREARSASALEHSNICPVYEFGEHEGQPFLVMQLLEGHTLRELIAAAGPGTPPLELSKVLDLAVQIADGLDAAHQKGIIHRDIKPANIFVTHEGQAKILDFGLAKLASILSAEGDEAEPGAHGGGEAGIPRGTLPLSTPDLFLSRTGVAMGTAGYMSPEQVRDEKLDARTDLFSFGLVLYELATGKRAFAGDTGPELQEAILTQAPSPAREVNPHLPAKLERILHKALEKDREARYPSASEIRVDLESLKRDFEPGQRRRWRSMTGIGALLLFVAIAAFWIAKGQSASPIPPRELKLRQVTTNPPENSVMGAAISPDGKYLAYVDTKGMQLKLIETGQTQAIPPPAEPNSRNLEWRIVFPWFPDSTRFLAESHPSGQSSSVWSSQGSSIWIVSVFGGPPRKLRDEATADSISPDGSLIAFGTNKGRRGNREIWLMRSDGENARKLYESDEESSVSGLHWFPHGERVWYSLWDKNGFSLLTRQLSGGSVTTIPRPADMTSWDVTLLPDSRLLYVVGETGAVGFSCNYWVLPLDERTGGPTDGPKRLTNLAGTCPIGTSMTADGKKLAFLNWGKGRAPMDVTDLDDSEMRIVNTRRFAASEGWDNPMDWTGDGKELIFTSNRNGHYEIFKQALNSETPETIVTGRGDVDTVRLSPDSRWLLYVESSQVNSQAPVQVKRVPLTGGSPTVVLTAGSYSDFRCARSPAALCVLSDATEDRKQFVFTEFDPQRGRGDEIARVDIITPAKVFHWDISPDGMRICFIRNAEAPIEILSRGSHAVQTVRVKDWSNLNSLSWDAGSEGFFISDQIHEGGVLLHVDLQGNAHVLRRTPGIGYAPVWPSPDGRHLIIQEYRMEGNIWTLEHF